MNEQAARLVRRFERQTGSAVQRSSQLYSSLLEHCTRDLTQRGPVWQLLADRADEPAGDALPLRLMAAVHWLVLNGQAPGLALSYPSVGGTGDVETAWPAFRSVLQDQSEELRSLLSRPLQTNEVRRCSALLVGLSSIALATDHPLRTLEVGTSAGLNLNWHRYRYEGADGVWGPTESPVRLALPSGTSVLFPPPLGEGIGCDHTPLDSGREADRRWLRSCVWADQVDRLATLDAALGVAHDHPPVVERCDAAVWLERHLDQLRSGTTTVVIQSIVQQYLSSAQRAELAESVTAAGARATVRSPLAWLRVEPPDKPARLPPGREGLVEIRVRLWPGGTDRLLGYAGYHGQPVHVMT